MAVPEPRFPLRERGTGQIHDLAVSMLRSHWRQIVGLLLPGAVLVSGIGWLLASVVADEQGHSAGIAVAIAWTTVMIPLASSPVTAWLAEATFADAVPARQGWRRWRSRGGPLLAAQVRRWGLAAVAGMLLLADAHWAWGIPVVMVAADVWWLFGSEVVVLEGQRWGPSRKRMRQLNKHSDGGGIPMALIEWVVWVLPVFVLGIALAVILGLFVGGEWDPSAHNWLIDPVVSPLPWAVVWMAVGYTTTVRFLLYVNLRTRVEGWAVETSLRLAAERLEQVPGSTGARS